MSNENIILKRFGKAEQRLKAAQHLYEQAYYEDSISRSYFAIFFATKALLLTKDVNPQTHSGVKNQF
ncbi:MAG: HEPN domain-containing protein, partial [Dehalococcoidia bacterium]